MGGTRLARRTSCSINVDFNTYPLAIDSSKATVPSAPFVQAQPLTERKFSETSPVPPSPSPFPCARSEPVALGSS